jgi:hypothetical protein
MKIISLVLLFLSIITHNLLSKNIQDSVFLENVLSQIGFLDQKIRIDLDNYSNSHELEAYLYKTMEEVDSINQSIVFPVIDSILSGNLKNLSENSWRTCFLILQHSNIKNRLKYIDFVYEYYKKGLIKNYEYLIFIDRLSVNLNKAQPFGSQVIEFPNRVYFVYPTIDKHKRDSCFHNIGMEPELFKIINGSMHYGKSVKTLDSSISENQYNAKELSFDNFLIFGYITSDTNKAIGLNDIKIFINNECVTTTDKNGVFSYIISKKNIPDKLEIVYGEKLVQYHIDKKELNDFIFVSIIFK